METCDVLIAGGGPAGSTCAWALRRAGLDALVVDRSPFPRDKVCAGWITAQVAADLRLDLDAYRQGRTLQAITGFRTGVIGRDREVEIEYGRPVSYGIRRCEFDDYLLRRSGARVELGAPVTELRREGAFWIVNDRFRASMLVGAGGHFCPVAQHVNGPPAGPGGSALVVAREAEFPVGPADAALFTTRPETPELFFSHDLKGYGWCFRKQDYVNVGFGSLDRRLLPQATSDFTAFLARRGTIPARSSWPWRGHAYLLHEQPPRRIVGEGLVLIGDAAGLAYPRSGEGIRPAIESGLIAASTIVEAAGRYTRDRLVPYQSRVRARLGASTPPALASLLPPAVLAGCARLLLGVPLFVRHVVLDRWFLHAHDPALAAS
jgi:flavin-dependent dehydrogenase